MITVISIFAPDDRLLVMVLLGSIYHVKWCEIYAMWENCTIWSPSQIRVAPYFRMSRMSFHVHQHILFIGFIKVYLVMLVTKKNGVIDLGLNSLRDRLFIFMLCLLWWNYRPFFLDCAAYMPKHKATLIDNLVCFSGITFALSRVIMIEQSFQFIGQGSSPAN